MTPKQQPTNNNTPPVTADEPVVVPVSREHHIARARQTAAALAGAIGFRRVLVYSVATSVSELANNLYFHTGRGGLITLTALRRNGRTGIEIIAADEGPGIPDVALAMRDGFSTDGGLGGGLPGVERLMDEFEISSTVGLGTRIAARKWQPCR